MVVNFYGFQLNEKESVIKIVTPYEKKNAFLKWAMSDFSVVVSLTDNFLSPSTKSEKWV